MNNKHIILQNNNFEYDDLLRNLTRELENSECDYLIVSSVDELKTNLTIYPSSIVYLFPMDDDIYELCGELVLRNKLICPVLAINENDINYKKAMYVGAIDFITKLSTEEEIKTTIYKSSKSIEMKEKAYIEDKETGTKKKRGKLITICSGKGGVGKTTLAVNLASSFEKQNKNVCIIDLDLQFGDVPIFLDVKPKKSIIDWVNDYNINSVTKISRYLTFHTENLAVLAAPKLPEQADDIMSKHVQVILKQLLELYDVVLVDTPPLFTDTVLTSLEESDFILSPVTPNLTAIKNVKVTLNTLKQLKWHEKTHLVLNRANEANNILKEKEIEKMIGVKIWDRVPSDYCVTLKAINLGYPFVYEVPRKKISKSVINIAKRLMKEGD